MSEREQSPDEASFRRLVENMRRILPRDMDIGNGSIEPDSIPIPDDPEERDKFLEFQELLDKSSLGSPESKAFQAETMETVRRIRARLLFEQMVEDGRLDTDNQN